MKSRFDPFLNRDLNNQTFRQQQQARLDAGNARARAEFDALRPVGTDFSKAYRASSFRC